MRKTGRLAAFLLMALAQPVPTIAEFQVNTFTTNHQVGPSIALDGSGNFVVVWNSYGQVGCDYSDVFGQRFDSNATPLGGEFQINTYTTSNQALPSVAMDGSGNLVVIWQSNGQDGSGEGVFGRRFDSAEAPLGAEFQVNTYTTDHQFFPSVAVNGSGDFVVAWGSYGLDGAGSGVFGRRFDSAGAPLGGEFQINTYTTFNQFGPSVALDGSGNFVVAWSSLFQDGDFHGVFGQRFGSAGTPRGGEFQVNTYATELQWYPRVALDSSGNFVVAWSSLLQDGSGWGVFGQGFDSAGAPLGGEFQINTYTTNSQAQPSIAMDGSGNFEVVWSSFQDGSGYGVFGQGFCADIDVDGDGVCNSRDVVITSPLDGDTLDCSDPAVIRPVITWSAGNYEKFRVSIASDPNFVTGTVVTSGDMLFSSTSYTPPGKKWKSACKKALAANPSAPVLYIRVFGVIRGVPKLRANRLTFSPVVRVDVTP